MGSVCSYGVQSDDVSALVAWFIGACGKIREQANVVGAAGCVLVNLDAHVGGAGAGKP